MPSDAINQQILFRGFVVVLAMLVSFGIQESLTPSPHPVKAATLIGTMKHWPAVVDSERTRSPKDLYRHGYFSNIWMKLLR